MLNPKAKSIDIDGYTYLIAPLSMAQIEKMAAISNSASATIGEKRDAIWTALYASLTRAGAEHTPTLDDLKEALDVDGFLTLQQAVFELSAVRAL